MTNLIMIRCAIFRLVVSSPGQLAKRTIRPLTAQLSSNLFQRQMAPFSIAKSAESEQSDELLTYQGYLRKHNQSLKKPHEKLRTEQQRIIKKYLSSSREGEVIRFLSNNFNLRLCHTNTSAVVDKHLASRYAELSSQDKRLAAFSLISFRENRLFSLFKQQREAELLTSSVEDINIEDTIVYLYGQLINYKNTNFLRSVKASLPKDKIIQVIYQCLSFTLYQGRFKVERDLLMQYLSLVLNPSLNKSEQKAKVEKKRSVLETDVESFLKVIGYKIQREIVVNNYAVDYVVQVEGEEGTKRVALEVNGSYHYTLNHKLKGREVLRSMIINQCIPLRIVHHQDFLQSRGYRNKQAYIEQILNSHTVNWECRNKGTNSNWEVSQTEQLF